MYQVLHQGLSLLVLVKKKLLEHSGPVDYVFPASVGDDIRLRDDSSWRYLLRSGDLFANVFGIEVFLQNIVFITLHYFVRFNSIMIEEKGELWK
jgi:hypothetical protein